MIYGGPSSHFCGLRCNCVHDSKARFKHYNKEPGVVIMQFKEKCPVCHYNYWIALGGVWAKKELIEGDIE